MTRGDWMQTFTGRRFWPLSPGPDDVDAEDIAHALGLLCRYNGHVERFYSVAEHCWLLSYAVAPENALHALLHDATEAYVGDMIRPLKRSMPDFRVAEQGVWRAIVAHFGVAERIPDEVHVADSRILLNERAVLMPNTRHPWGIDHLAPLDLTGPFAPVGVPPQQASAKYASRLAQLLSAADQAEAVDRG